MKTAYEADGKLFYDREMAELHLKALDINAKSLAITKLIGHLANEGWLEVINWEYVNKIIEAHFRGLEE